MWKHVCIFLHLFIQLKLSFWSGPFYDGRQQKLDSVRFISPFLPYYTHKVPNKSRQRKICILKKRFWDDAGHWNWNFTMTLSVCPSVGRSAGRSDSLSVRISKKGEKFHFHAPIGALVITEITETWCCWPCLFYETKNSVKNTVSASDGGDVGSSSSCCCGWICVALRCVTILYKQLYMSPPSLHGP